jgi:hypothetical protein
MAPNTLTQMQQSQAAPVLPGSWKLAPGRAMTFQPREAGILRVSHGQLWITFDGPQHGPRDDLGDHFFGAGEQIRLRGGQRLVAEAWNGRKPAYFSWDPLPVRSAAPRLAALAQPLRDLRLAWALGAGAARRLVAGLARVAWELVARRSRDALAECAFDAQASSCRAGSS